MLLVHLQANRIRGVEAIPENGMHLFLLFTIYLMRRLMDRSPEDGQDIRLQFFTFPCGVQGLIGDLMLIF